MPYSFPLQAPAPYLFHQLEQCDKWMEHYQLHIMYTHNRSIRSTGYPSIDSSTYPLTLQSICLLTYPRACLYICPKSRSNISVSLRMDSLQARRPACHSVYLSENVAYDSEKQLFAQGRLWFELGRSV